MAKGQRLRASAARRVTRARRSREFQRVVSTAAGAAASVEKSARAMADALFMWRLTTRRCHVWPMLKASQLGALVTTPAAVADSRSVTSRRIDRPGDGARRNAPHRCQRILNDILPSSGFGYPSASRRTHHAVP